MNKIISFVIFLSAFWLAGFVIPGPALAETSTTTGYVYDEAGTAIVNASVNIYKADYSANYGSGTGADGSYIVSVPPGAYKIRAFPPYGVKYLISADPLDITVLSGEILAQNLTLLSAV